jgi:hypothetical protein
MIGDNTMDEKEIKMLKEAATLIQDLKSKLDSARFINGTVFKMTQSSKKTCRASVCVLAETINDAIDKTIQAQNLLNKVTTNTNTKGDQQ